MEHFEFSLTSLLIVTVLSFIVPLMIKRIKRFYIPVVVGEILVGMVIGKSGFDLIVMDESLAFIQFFGLAYLMFVAGLEIDFNIFLFNSKDPKKNGFKGKGMLKNPLILSLMILTITLVFAYISSNIMMQYGLIQYPFLMALIIGTTSLGIVVPILKEKRISSSPYGQYIITSAVIADFVTMLLISVAVSLFKGGFSLEILLVFGLLVLVFLLYRLSSKLHENELFKELAHGTTQIGIRGAFAVMLLFLVLSQSIGVEMILGSFLAGTVISLVSQSRRDDIYNKLDAIGFGFLIPTFFILVGVNFDISVLIDNPKGLLLVPLLLVLVYLIKGLPALLLRLVFPWKKAIAGGVLLTSKLSLTIAAAAIGLEIGAISEEVSAAILLVSILTSLFSPIIFGKMIPANVDTEEEHPVYIIGTTKQAILLAKRLVNFGIHVVIIENKREKVEDIMLTGIEIAWGDAKDQQLLEELEIDKSRAIIVATGSDSVNFEVAECITESFPVELVTIVVNNVSGQEDNPKIKVVNTQLSTVNLLENMIRHPLAAEILEDKRGIHMEEIKIKNPSLFDRSLRYITLPGDVLIFSLYRDGETILPHGDTKFQYGDILLVVGNDKDVLDFKRIARNQ